VLIRFVLLVLAAYALFAALVWFYAERLIFQPPAGRYPSSPDVVSIPRPGGGTVSAVHVRDPEARYTVLFSHGNAESIWHNLDFVREMAGAGFSVLAYAAGLIRTRRVPARHLHPTIGETSWPVAEAPSFPSSPWRCAPRSAGCTSAPTWRCSS
jgi:hypothetical protein